MQQTRHEPFVSYVPKVIDLVEHVSGHPVQMWGKEDRETMYDLFDKGLWDFEAVYLVNYLSKETFLDNLSKEQLVDKARHLDQNHSSNGRTLKGHFHPWRQWLASCKDLYDSWWQGHAKGHARGGPHNHNRRYDKSSGAPAKPAWSANPISEDPQVE